MTGVGWRVAGKRLTLAPGSEAAVVEVATALWTGSDGSFFTENIEAFDVLEPGQTTWLDSDPLKRVLTTCTSRATRRPASSARSGSGRRSCRWSSETRSPRSRDFAFGTAAGTSFGGSPSSATATKRATTRPASSSSATGWPTSFGNRRGTPTFSRLVLAARRGLSPGTRLVGSSASDGTRSVFRSGMATAL
jgi:hypothetical protein